MFEDHADQVKHGRIHWVRCHQHWVPEQVVEPGSHKKLGYRFCLLFLLFIYFHFWLVFKSRLLNFFLHLRTLHLRHLVKYRSKIRHIPTQLKVEFKHNSQRHRHQEQFLLQALKHTIDQFNTQRCQVVYVI